MSKRIQHVGIEYELEGLNHHYDEWNHYNGMVSGWRVTNDGTLRGRAAEFVSSILDLSTARERVQHLLECIGYDYEVTHRCSMHIHVSIDGLRRWQRLALYMMLVAEEEWFFQFNPERKKNHYCTPLLYTPAFYQGLATMTATPDWDEGRPVRNTRTLRMRNGGSSCKYTSVNTQPALADNLGTIELRHFAPLMDIDQVSTVLDTIQSITDLAHECPHNKSEDMYSFLLKQADLFHSPRALKWVVEAVRQLQDELNGGQPEPEEPEGMSFADAIRRAELERIQTITPVPSPLTRPDISDWLTDDGEELDELEDE